MGLFFLLAGLIQTVGGRPNLLLARARRYGWMEERKESISSDERGLVTFLRFQRVLLVSSVGSVLLALSA